MCEIGEHVSPERVTAFFLPCLSVRYLLCSWVPTGTGAINHNQKVILDKPDACP